MKLDLHIHSKYSFDSFLDPLKIIEVARRRGLQGIAITDHNTVRGGIVASRLNKHEDFVVVVGSEVSTDQGDMIGLFLSDDVKPGNAEEVMDGIRDRGGICVLAHPFKRRVFSSDLMGALDAIEAFNSRVGDYSLINRALETARRFQLPVTGGSDAHFYREVGRGRCRLEHATGEEDVRKCIVRGDATVEGTLTSPYLEMLSQAVRSFKEREPRLLITSVAAGAASLAYRHVRQTLARSP